MTLEPQDEVVKKEIIATVSNCLEAHIRPNKLRKLICKKIDRTNWTQYQRVLDELLQDKTLRTKAVNGELVILPSLLPLRDKDRSEKREGANPSSSSEAKKKTEVMKVPLAIVRHLLKKGHKKQSNIEKNSKSKLFFTKESLAAVRTKHFDHGDEADITITKYYDDDDEESAQKQLKNAVLMVSKMVQAYKNSPDHFRQKEAGGTLEYQEEVKKRKLEIEKKRGQKDREDMNGGVKIVKKRSRKYY